MSRRLRLKAQGASSRNLGCRAYIQCVHIYVYIYIYVFSDIHMYIGLCTVCMYVDMCIYIYIYIYIYMRIYLLTFLSICLSIYVQRTGGRVWFFGVSGFRVGA